MELKYQLKPSLIKTNARFRGPTELSKYTNMVNETVHDLKMLGKVLDKDDFFITEARGQSNFIADNFSAYYTGDTSLITSNIKTSTELYTQKDPIVSSVNLLTWNVYGGCARTGLAAKPTLAYDGTATPCGVSSVLDVQDGYLVYIRMFARIVTGEANSFTIGSDNINQGIGNFGTYPLTPGTGIYVGHILECRQKESINISIDVARSASVGHPGTIELSDVSITLLDRSHVVLRPLNTSLKAQVNILDEKIKNIINNL